MDAFYVLNKDAFKDGRKSRLAVGIALNVPSKQSLSNLINEESSKETIENTAIKSLNNKAQGTNSNSKNDENLNQAEKPLGTNAEFMDKNQTKENKAKPKNAASISAPLIEPDHIANSENEVIIESLNPEEKPQNAINYWPQAIFALLSLLLFKLFIVFFKRIKKQASNVPEAN